MSGWLLRNALARLSLVQQPQQHLARAFASAHTAHGLVVQKYGGTSLGTAEKLEKVSRIVAQFHKENSVVAVVSALSSETKAEGTTNRLLAAADAAINPKPNGPGFKSYLDKIADTHFDVIYKMLRNEKTREAVKAHVTNELEIVRQFCQSLQVIRELSPRSHDLIVGAGERLAAGLVAGVLTESGIPAKYVDFSNLWPEGLDTTKPGYHHSAKIAMRELLTEAINSSPKGTVPVCTGYIGQIEGGIIKGVGRGYSDLTAALTAAAMSADALQVWKESDGIFTANPTKIKEARLLHYVTPREAAELTYFGNEVLHPFTMECAIEASIPIHILNTFTPTSPGTVVDPHRRPEDTRSSSGVVAVASKKNISVVNISSNRMLGSTTYLAKVFEAFAKHKVKVDLISTSETNLSITVHESVLAKDIQGLVDDLSSLGKCTVSPGRAVVSAIGEGMKHQVGLASNFFDCLSKNGVNVEMISQGASEINMSVVIDQEDVDRAIKAVHSRFLAQPVQPAK